ncbi:hypothetical protein SBA1_1030039 [Candidatus Sulfotelmatobacter kueseliae]|uniref:Helix-turn-helix domain-containing protein n=1 Tax=Candidatus Sulfotelmatobacter kueseliae TaxID=2042962 RepID=A0A2U3JXF8_9BACT|nr:hypothetical protein SBA1_1030039 [Candidatus Sulfotelmatobacter kueseliae]
MSAQSLDVRSSQPIEREAPKPFAVPLLSPKTTFELIDAPELAKRLNLPVSWIRAHCRRRTLDELPVVRFGKYCRFRWGSPELEKWIAAHEVSSRG